MLDLYSGYPNTGRVRYSNALQITDFIRMVDFVRYSNGGLWTDSQPSVIQMVNLYSGDSNSGLSVFGIRMVSTEYSDFQWSAIQNSVTE